MPKQLSPGNSPLEIEVVAESFSVVDISNVRNDKGKGAKGFKGRGNKWTRRNVNAIINVV